MWQLFEGYNLDFNGKVNKTISKNQLSDVLSAILRPLFNINASNVEEIP